MKYTPSKNLPEALNNLICNGGHSRKRTEVEFSVTDITKPTQMVYLTRKHDDEIVLPAEEGIWMMFGSLLHNQLQQHAGNNALVEEKIRVNIPLEIRHDNDIAERVEFTLTGMPDHYTEDDGGTITDYKSTSVFSVKDALTNKGKDEWTLQLNCYRYIMRHIGFKVSKLKIVAICKDWRRSEASRDPSYPAAITTIDIPVMDDDEIENVIQSKLFLHYMAIKYHNVPQCTDEERWATPQKWALMKNNAAKATKLFDNENEALLAQQKLGPQYFVEERPRQYNRCSYCNANAFCTQLQKNKTMEQKFEEAGL